jgi:threonine synthase
MMLRYHSTRGQSPAASPAEALLNGAASDGGLYMPDSFPDLSGLLTEDLNYQGLSARVFSALLPDFSRDELEGAARAAYGAQFNDGAIAPLKELGGCHILELSHGPTAAFKDLALQALPRFMALAREKLGRDEHYLVLAATSGDTGSAAMRGFRDISGFRVLVFYPHGGVSAVQLAQMTRMKGNNLRAVGIRGDFDRAQAGVKEVFSMEASGLPDNLRLSSANSINIGRLIPQIVYYISAIRRLQKTGALRPGQAADFIVPSGNFGDILAGYMAGRMGLPVGKLVCASNENSVLTDFLATGMYDRRRKLRKTLSPSMDILVSSNLERLLYEASGRDTERVSGLMEQLKTEGHYHIDGDMLNVIRGQFVGRASNDAEAMRAIRDVWQRYGYLMDPHTAAAWLAQDALAGRDNPRVVLSTASPFKFPGAVLKALGREADMDCLPEDLARETGVEIPRSLHNLIDSPVLYPDVIDPEDMTQTVRREAGRW